MNQRIFKKLEPSETDRRALSGTVSNPAFRVDDHFDYSKVVVKKPWGYEYLIYQNRRVAVWILFIKSGFQTSMHCHPTKKTSITILSGKARCSILERGVPRGPGQALLIGKGVFHRTQSLSQEGTYVMEVETSTNKRDLVRLLDDYGRQKLGYETLEHMTFNLSNYNYMSLIDPAVYYNVKKRFGSCAIELTRFGDDPLWRQRIQSSKWNLLCLLKGKISDRSRRRVWGPGDLMTHEDLKAWPGFRLAGEVEAIVVQDSDTMIRLSDFIVLYLKKKGLKDIFFVAGTANAHLIDAVGRDTEVRSISLQTEQAATLAAEAYSKLTGQNSLVILSSGSSTTDAITGIADAWIDSVPVVVLSGQSRPSHLGIPGETRLRQLVNKELNIADVIRPLVKYTTVVRDPFSIKQHLDRALFLSRDGRQGPVWLDIPIDLLGTNLDEKKISSEENIVTGEKSPRPSTKLSEVIELLKKCRRPVLLAGHGVRASGAEDEFLELAKTLAIPVLLSRRGIDLLGEDFPFYFGRPGTYGHRAANFMIQNSDLLLSIGTRLSLPLIGRNYKAFAREAVKIVVDRDAEELKKTTLHTNLAISMDAGDFIRQMLRQLAEVPKLPAHQPWKRQCEHWRTKFPPDREFKYFKTGAKWTNPYFFVRALSDVLGHEDIVVVDGGPCLDYVMQAFRVKRGQRIISSPGLEHQGFSLPGAIGASLGSAGARVICLCEKKGLQLTTAELQTIANNHLPVKIFVFNTRGNTNVQRVQASYFGGRYVGRDNTGRVDSLNVKKLGEAYKIKTDFIDGNKTILTKIKRILACPDALLCEMLVPEDLELIPRLIFKVKPDGRWISKPLEDMYPLLDREEFKKNMIVDVFDEKS